MFSRKRRRNEGEGEDLDADGNVKQTGEPPVSQDVPPSTASVILDSAQAPYSAIGEEPPAYLLGTGHLVKNLTSLINPSAAADIPPAGSRSIDSGKKFNIVQGGLSGLGNFKARLNPVSGCPRIKSFGSVHSGAEWDTHRGNSILSVRMFGESVVALDPHYVWDMYILIPPGYVFNQDYDEEGENLRYIMDHLLQFKTSSSRSHYLEYGWTFGRPFLDATWLPLGVSPFRIRRNPQTKKLYIQMDTSVLNPNYRALSTFLVFDHPNSITTRGALLTGFGYANPSYKPSLSAEQASDSSSTAGGGEDTVRYSNYPFVSYPQRIGNVVGSPATDGGNAFISTSPMLVERTAPLLTNTVTGRVVDLAQYGQIKIESFQYISRMNGGGAAGDAIARSYIMNMGGRNIYSAARPPLMKDSRYFIHNSDEIAYTQKLIPQTNRTLVSGFALGPSTFNVDFRSFETKDEVGGGGVTGTGSNRAWRDTTYSGHRYNPAIHIAKHSSMMFMDVKSYNEYGEGIIPSIEGTAPLARSLVYVPPDTTDAFTPVVPPDSLRPYLDYLYPGPNPPNALERSFSSYPPWALEEGNNEPSYSLTFLRANPTIAARDYDLLNYTDNGVRCSAGDSQIHFLLNEMY